MVAITQQSQKMTVEEYLKWELQQDVRYEYVNGEKFTYYLKIPSLQEYVLIDSEKISVERYCRGEGRMWLYYPYTAKDIITLSSIEFECPIELLYESVIFGTEE